MTVLGPLPPLYRVVVAVVALFLCVGGGAWAAFMLPYPILVSVGASIGLAVGALLTYVLLHNGQARPQPHRARHHRLR
jgi:uncharacterized membrane protein YccC